jgi:hypothetical protein
MKRLLFVIPVLVLVGCEGAITNVRMGQSGGSGDEPGSGGAGSGMPLPMGGAGEVTGGSGLGMGTGGGSAQVAGGSASGGSNQVANVTCNMATYPNVQMADILNAFRADVYPSMTNGAAQCATCHASASNRQFIVTSMADETFHKARAQGFFNNQAGSLVARVNADLNSRMPPMGQPGWSKTEIESIAKVACMVQTFEANGGPLSDEQFPPELLLPFTGVTTTTYDNSFLNFVQLKGKVKGIFNDTWTRTAVDQFDANISQFGGVNFRTTFVEARTATGDFLLGLDKLAPDICGAAATNKTGPFVGTDLVTSITDVAASQTQNFEAETVTIVPATGAGSRNAMDYFCYTNCTLTSNITLPGPGQYQVIVRAKAMTNANGPPEAAVTLGSVVSTPNLVFTDNANFTEKTATVTVTAGGAMAVSVRFPNDDVDANGGDRNIYFDSFRVIGPIGAGTGMARQTAAKAQINTIYQKMLFRNATALEQTNAYTLLVDLLPFGNVSQAWSGLCESLIRHPDFLFTMPPAISAAPAIEKDKIRLVALTQQLVGRTPSASELTLLTASGFGAVVDSLLASTEFRDYFFNRIQLRIESKGTPQTDEPARLWTHVVINGKPFKEVLAADYSVDATFAKIARPAEHGKTGVLTMKGYIENKPGLPHYNYAARVVSGFMGRVFEVPPEVFEQRATATASSTVDTRSVCFSCHSVLTPLSHQRLKWDDNGVFHPTDANGAAIDDTDRSLVANYPYKGAGMEAFSTVAVRKEAFVRRMINTQFRLLMGREMRSADDERVVYKQLWDLALANNGDLKKVTRAIALSPNFQR